MASSRLDCVFGVVRLISSASTMFVNSGPGLNTKSPRSAWYTVTPRMSDGSMSEVNWIRWNPPPMERASAAARVVFPTPGTSSISRCPRARRPMTARRIVSGLPTSAWATLASSRRTRSSARVAIYSSYCTWPAPQNGQSRLPARGGASDRRRTERLRPDRQRGHAPAERPDRVGHGVGDGRGSADGAALAHALHAAGRQRRRRLQVADLEGGHVVRLRQRVVHERRREQLAVSVVDDRLEQRLAEALGDGAVDLALHDRRVHDRPAVLDDDVAANPHAAGGAVDLHPRHVHGPGERRAGRGQK